MQNFSQKHFIAQTDQSCSACLSVESYVALLVVSCILRRRQSVSARGAPRVLLGTAAMTVGAAAVDIAPI